MPTLASGLRPCDMRGGSMAQDSSRPCSPLLWRLPQWSHFVRAKWPQMRPNCCQWFITRILDSWAVYWLGFGILSGVDHERPG